MALNAINAKQLLPMDVKPLEKKSDRDFMM